MTTQPLVTLVPDVAADMNRRVGITITEMIQLWNRNVPDTQKLTQDTIATHLGVTRPYVSQMLNGRKRIPAEYLPRIAQLLGVNPDGIAMPGQLQPKTRETHYRRKAATRLEKVPA